MVGILYGKRLGARAKVVNDVRVWTKGLALVVEKLHRDFDQLEPVCMNFNGSFDGHCLLFCSNVAPDEVMRTNRNGLIRVVVVKAETAGNYGYANSKSCQKRLSTVHHQAIRNGVVYTHCNGVKLISTGLVTERMYIAGHVGAALLCYAPVAAALVSGGHPELAAVGIGVAVAVAGLPDIDESLPIDHRGPTHTVWFAVGVALLGGVVGLVGGGVIGDGVLLGAVLASAVFLSLFSHLLADSITPMGIRPFAPVSSWHLTFDIVPAANVRANAAFLSGGIGGTGLCLLLVV